MVRVGGFRIDALVVVDVLEGTVHGASLAAVAVVLGGSGAVHQVLLADADQFTGLVEGLPFQGSGSTEGPAGTALALREYFRGGRSEVFALR